VGAPASYGDYTRGALGLGVPYGDLGVLELFGLKTNKNKARKILK